MRGFFILYRMICIIPRREIIWHSPYQTIPEFSEGAGAPRLDAQSRRFCTCAGRSAEGNQTEYALFSLAVCWRSQAHPSLRGSLLRQCTIVCSEPACHAEITPLLFQRGCTLKRHAKAGIQRVQRKKARGGGAAARQISH